MRKGKRVKRRMRTAIASFLSLNVGLVLGLCLSSCTVVTDPTKASSDLTSSTSPGGSSTTLRDEEKARAFAVVNFERLKKDMAAGQGEHLAAFSVLLHVPPEQQSAFFAFAQEKFSIVYPSEQVNADDMMMALSREL